VATKSARYPKRSRAFVFILVRPFLGLVGAFNRAARLLAVQTMRLVTPLSPGRFRCFRMRFCAMTVFAFC
jgi:hypothetical protein